MFQNPSSLCLTQYFWSRLKASRDGEFPSGFSLFQFLIEPDMGKRIYFCFNVYKSSFSLCPTIASEMESNSISLSEVFTSVKCPWKRANVLPVLLSIPCDGGSGGLADMLRIAIDTVFDFVNTSKSISCFTSVSVWNIMLTCPISCYETQSAKSSLG